jgi:flagellar hook-basal body complex protein FliE
MSLIGAAGINPSAFGVGGVGGLNGAGGLSGIGAPGTGSLSGSPAKLSDSFSNFIRNTNQDQVQAEQAVQQLVEGKTDNVQQVVLAMAQAEMSFQLFMEIRNKLTETYNELMRMQF